MPVSARDSWKDLKDDYSDEIKAKIKTKADFGPLLDKWEEAEEWKLKTFNFSNLEEAIGIFGDLFFAASDYMEQLGFKDIPNVSYSELHDKQHKWKFDLNELGGFLATYRYKSLQKVAESLRLANVFNLRSEWKLYKRCFGKQLAKAKVDFNQGFGPAIDEFEELLAGFQSGDKDADEVKIAFAKLRKITGEYAKKITAAKLPTLVEELFKLYLDSVPKSAVAVAAKLKLKL